jgi:hypothetical protein
MGKIKAKQIALAAPFVSGTGEALDLATGGVTNGYLASGIDGSKISNSTAPGSILTNASVAGAKLMPNTVGADRLEQSVLNMINRGTSLREAVLTTEQLKNGAMTSGVAPATVIVVDTNPSEDDTFVLKDGDATEVYTFVASELVPFQVLIGANAAATAANLQAAIAADSARWGATLEANLTDIAAAVVVIYRTAAVASGAEDDRVYAPVGTGLKHVNFASGRYDATISTAGAVTAIDAGDLVSLPDADPTSSTFGYGRAVADLIDGDLRFVMADNVGYAYDADENAWNLGLGGNIAAGSVGPNELNASVAGNGLSGGGGSALAVNVDDTGIEIISDTLRLKDGGVTAAKLGATSVTAAKLGSDVAGNGLTGGNGSALAVLGANTSVNVSGSGIKAAIPVKDDKALNPTGAVSTDETDTGLDITKTPAAGSYVTVQLNGVSVELGDGVKTKDCYFSADGGSSARAIADIVATDSLYWNAVISGVNLSTSDEIDLHYLNTTP